MLPHSSTLLIGSNENSVRSWCLVQPSFKQELAQCSLSQPLSQRYAEWQICTTTPLYGSLFHAQRVTTVAVYFHTQFAPFYLIFSSCFAVIPPSVLHLTHHPVGHITRVLLHSGTVWWTPSPILGTREHKHSHNALFWQVGETMLMEQHSHVDITWC